jgi:hypothetical protein
MENGAPWNHYLTPILSIVIELFVFVVVLMGFLLIEYNGHQASLWLPSTRSFI